MGNPITGTENMNIHVVTCSCSSQIISLQLLIIHERGVNSSTFVDNLHLSLLTICTLQGCSSGLFPLTMALQTQGEMPAHCNCLVNVRSSKDDWLHIVWRSFGRFELAGARHSNGNCRESRLSLFL
eukprot:5423418-Amphidinium_carterae.2